MVREPSSEAEALTFLFNDLESSTRLWEEFPDAMKTAVERHDAILRSWMAAAAASSSSPATD